ncbi:hypothetical protein [Streptomonospora arabica]|uniref:Uncharacterized protein n=1 Tax=Streptomonospora arabica TaxID=412417 RepID=A0ABV9STW1_9ACTN
MSGPAETLVAPRPSACTPIPPVPPPGTVDERDPGDPQARTRASGADRVSIGRRLVHDAGGAPLVIDWRARISAAFHRAGPDDPQGVVQRRRSGFSDDAELTAYADEHLAASGAAHDGVAGRRRADRPEKTWSARPKGAAPISCCA